MSYDPQKDGLGADGDRVYAALMASHDGLSEAQSHELNTRLVLMLANEVGDADRLEALFNAARALGEAQTR